MEEDSFDMKTGVASCFKDLMQLRHFEPPEILVCEPQKKKATTGTHHVYRVVGRDHHGTFEVFRRFKEFYLIRKVLYSRFLGLYVPPVPEKKSVVRSSLRLMLKKGNTDNSFVEERLFFLDRFMKEICILPYLYESHEFATFLRPTGEVDKALETLPPLSTDDLLMRFRNALPINEVIL
jgi:hypothetical protein